MDRYIPLKIIEVDEKRWSYSDIKSKKDFKRKKVFYKAHYLVGLRLSLDVDGHPIKPHTYLTTKTRIIDAEDVL